MPSFGINLNETEFIQYLSLVGGELSLKTCARRESLCLLLIFISLLKGLLPSLSPIFLGTVGFVDLEHLVPESYLSIGLKRGSQEKIST